MLQHMSDLGFRAGAFTAHPVEPGEITQILSLVREFYGPDADSATLHPHDNAAHLRAALRQAAPGIAALADNITGLLESDYSAVVVPKIGLNHLDLDTRRFVLFGITLSMGSPTATDRIDRKIIWDIKARNTEYVATFSEHSDEADFHTDTQYFPEPERYLMLYFITPAACGGGVSSLRDARCIAEGLSQTEEGRWALEFLKQQAVPFRIPTTFTTNRSSAAVEVTFAKIFGARPMIRYRTDTLERGLAAYPEYDTPEVRKALALFRQEIDRPERMLEKYLDADALIVINNHEILHGRGAFTDTNRHVLRIRISDDQPQDEARMVIG